MNKVHIAMYLRLSKEDDKIKLESNSIKTQRLLISSYVREHFTSYKLEEYVDDGFSGTNFNRPGIDKMLSKARNGDIDCVIVKDFSRFARDYIELGSYLEQIFPFLGIRFISINDNYDSESYKGNIADLDIKFKNLLYDYYSKDISQKVRTSLAVRKAEGQYVSSHTPFGYQKALDDRHMLIIKMDEAKIVRRIYDMALNGKSINQIAKELNYDGIKTPIEFKIEMGDTSRKPKGDKFTWSPSTIASILRNRVYVGDVVYGKTEKEYVGGRNVLKPRCEWKVYQDHHEAIISKDVFEEIQKTRGKAIVSRCRTPKSILQGLALCSKCKKSMQYKELANPYFTCKERYITNDSDCCSKMNVMFLEQAVLYELEKHLSEIGLSDNEETLIADRKFIERYIQCVLVKDDRSFTIVWKE